MKIRKKIALIVFNGVLLSSLLGALPIYQFIETEVLKNEFVKLQEMTRQSTSLISERFLESEPKLKGLAPIIENELNKPIQPNEIHAFHTLMEQNISGIWLNRQSTFNGKMEAGAFIPEATNQSDDLKIRYLRIKRVIDIFGAAANKKREDVWFLSLSRGEIMFDKNDPNYVFHEKADADYRQTPWVTYGSPDINPNKEVLFTPPLFDPGNQSWMVSAVYPVYHAGQWVGSIGEDMQLSNVFAYIFEAKQLYAKSQHFLIDAQGNFVLAGQWQKQLESPTENTTFNLNTEPKLIALFHQKLTDTPQLLSNNIIVQNTRHIAIGMVLKPINWHYYLLVPVSEIMATIQELFFILCAMTLVTGLLNGGFIFKMTGKLVTNNIKILADQMERYSRHPQERPQNTLVGNDEISELAQLFDFMVNKIQSRDAQLSESLNRELRQQKQINQLQKLESIDRLTSGVAHDFNNILGCIYGYLDLTHFAAEDINQKNTDQEEIKTEILSNIEQMRSAAARAKNLIDKMLTYCRRDGLQKIENPVEDLHESITNTVSMLRAAIPKSIIFEISLLGISEKIALSIDETDLNQIILNLFINARDALESQKGIIKLATNITTDLKDLTCLCCSEKIQGDFVEIRVTDNGCGIESQIINRIFDPFFTTKTVDSGTGLGLSVISGIVHNANGHISVNSIVGKGTIFRLLFSIEQTQSKIYLNAMK